MGLAVRTAAADVGVEVSLGDQFLQGPLHIGDLVGSG